MEWRLEKQVTIPSDISENFFVNKLTLKTDPMIENTLPPIDIRILLTYILASD